MIFESITLENFRQFKDKETISFSTGHDKNISVIIGDNTSGKTTLLNAFKWALYQKNNFVSSKNKALNQSLLNKDTEKEMRKDGDTAKVKVVIRLIHDKSIYIISTSQEYYKVSGEVKDRPITSRISISSDNNESTENVFEDNLARKEISKILPEKLSDYFFFDTENINTITKKTNLFDSIKEILQLNVSEYLLDILNSDASQTVVKYLSSKKVYSNNEATSVLKEKQKVLSDQLENERFIKEECHKNIQNFESLLEDYNNDLAKFDKVENSIKEKKVSEDNLIKIKKSIKDEVNMLRNNFGNYEEKGASKIVDYLMSYQVKKTNLHSYLIKIGDEERGFSHIQSEAVDNIINAGICICGTPVTKGSHIYNHLLEEKKKMPPLSFSSNLNALSLKLGSNLAISKFYESIIQRNVKEISEKQKDFFEEKANLKRLTIEIGKSKESEVAKIQKDINEIKDKVTDLNRTIGKKEKNIEDLEKDLKEIEKKLVSSESDGIRNDRADNAIAVVKKIHSKVKENFDQKLKETREVLEEETTNVYNSIYHGKSGKIRIDKSFNASIIDSFGSVETDPGAGRNAVMNFSFVTGIVKMAKEKVDKEDRQIYPLVMDAPLSLLDETHINNLITVLPTIIDQIIIFVMDKDWDKAGKQVNQRIGKQYQIVKQKDSDGNFIDTYSKIKEVK
jgi:DNA sulfur modification protein DndD